MGTGKSSVGLAVASLLEFEFVDTDQLIETRAGRPIARIFGEEGEAAFRTYERVIVANLATLQRTVIATGGGLGANLENLASLRTHALIVCLWASPEVILERVGRQSHRPLLQVPNPDERVRELLAEREPVYRQADVLVNTGTRPLREVAHQVAHHFQLSLGQSAK